MELDNLKQAWKEQSLTDKISTDEEILAMLQKRSQRPIAKMKRNLLWELLVVLFLYAGTIAYYLTAQHGLYWELALLLAIIGAVFVFYYYRKNKLLKEMECVSCEVKSNLQRQIVVLEKYVRFYFIAGTILTPVAYFLAGLIAAKKSNFNFSLHSNFLIWFVGIGVGLTIAVYFLNVWYVNKLYGQHVKKLKQLLQETEEFQ